MPTWFIFASLSALFAALTSILAKIGIQKVDSNLATAIRTVVILVFSWGLVFLQKKPLTQGLDRYSLIFIILSGLATGLSWLFYFKALQVGEVSRVIPIDKFSLVLSIIFAIFLFKEKVGALSWFGIILIFFGTLLTTLSK